MIGRTQTSCRISSAGAVVSCPVGRRSPSPRATRGGPPSRAVWPGTQMPGPILQRSPPRPPRPGLTRIGTRRPRRRQRSRPATTRSPGGRERRTIRTFRQRTRSPLRDATSPTRCLVVTGRSRQAHIFPRATRSGLRPRTVPESVRPRGVPPAVRAPDGQRRGWRKATGLHSKRPPSPTRFARGQRVAWRQDPHASSCGSRTSSCASARAGTSAHTS
mmetsp:Transcript_29412/g.71042  ORF Transcript_29412/g.71042 Transcript_29412/m.71042 type:complete len:217 (+) Transcript_29412:725-1375(+)